MSCTTDGACIWLHILRTWRQLVDILQQHNMCSVHLMVHAYLVEGAGLVAGAVGAAPDLDLHAALAPLGDLVVDQIPGAFVGRVVKYLRPARSDITSPEIFANDHKGAKTTPTWGQFRLIST